MGNSKTEDPEGLQRLQEQRQRRRAKLRRQEAKDVMKTEEAPDEMEIPGTQEMLDIEDKMLEIIDRTDDEPWEGTRIAKREREEDTQSSVAEMPRKKVPPPVPPKPKRKPERQVNVQDIFNIEEIEHSVSRMERMILEEPLGHLFLNSETPSKSEE